MSWDDAGSLPVALSSLVGRQAELDTLATLAPKARLVTIVGAGGCGKTRLALAVAERCRAGDLDCLQKTLQAWCPQLCARITADLQEMAADASPR